MRVSVHVVGRLAMFTQITGVAFDGLAFVVADTSSVGFYKAAIENTSGQAFVIVRFNGFEIMDGDAGLIADFAQADTSRLAGSLRLWDTACRVRLLSRWFAGCHREDCLEAT